MLALLFAVRPMELGCHAASPHQSIDALCPVVMSHIQADARFDPMFGPASADLYVWCLGCPASIHLMNIG